MRPHIAHLLQLLDVSINWQVKANSVQRLGCLNKNQTINKVKFRVVLSHAIDEFCSPARVIRQVSLHITRTRSTNPRWQRVTRLPLGQTSQRENDEPTENTEPSTSSTETTPHCTTDEKPAQVTGVCATCGTFLKENSLVTECLFYHPGHVCPLIYTKIHKLVSNGLSLTTPLETNRKRNYFWPWFVCLFTNKQKHHGYSRF